MKRKTIVNFLINICLFSLIFASSTTVLYIVETKKTPKTTEQIINEIIKENINQKQKIEKIIILIKKQNFIKNNWITNEDYKNIVLEIEKNTEDSKELLKEAKKWKEKTIKKFFPEKKLEYDIFFAYWKKPDILNNSFFQPKNQQKKDKKCIYNVLIEIEVDWIIDTIGLINVSLILTKIKKENKKTKILTSKQNKKIKKIQPKIHVMMEYCFFNLTFESQNIIKENFSELK